MKQPIDKVQWIHRDKLKPNNYNPNMVAPPELRLLKISILEDGWTQPIVVNSDMTIVDGFHRWTLSKDKDGWIIHPLPLLTCEGNGRGGGDFRGNNPWIGKWARDVISIEKKLPIRKMKPFKDFKYEEIFPDFKE